jgi:3',5'-cyclic AMP phosphodiesterase CpdA
MPTLLQLSDLHFGPGYRSQLGQAILQDIDALNPEAVVLAGDFTLRARHPEYQAARGYLESITRPKLMVPGNHDQPVSAPLERLINPFSRYRKYIHRETDSALATDSFFIVGLNDNARLLPGGFWSGAQRAWLAGQLDQAPSRAVRVVVTHHQMTWEGKLRPAGFWGASHTLAFLACHGVELVLNGHTHIPAAVLSPDGIVVARAGTATSSRTRHGQGNTYNLIHVDDQQISVFVRRYDENNGAFIASEAYSFGRRANGN